MQTSAVETEIWNEILDSIYDINLYLIIVTAKAEEKKKEESEEEDDDMGFGLFD